MVAEKWLMVNYLLVVQNNQVEINSRSEQKEV